MALAARLPTACRAASSPNAEPRSWSGASWATAAVSAVSAQPIPMPARMKQPASSAKLSSGEREAEVGDQEACDSRGEDPQEPVAVAGVSCWDARERRCEVVGGVEHERELSRGGVRSPRLQ